MQLFFQTKIRNSGTKILGVGWRLEKITFINENYSVPECDTVDSKNNIQFNIFKIRILYIF